MCLFDPFFLYIFIFKYASFRYRPQIGLLVSSMIQTDPKRRPPIERVADAALIARSQSSDTSVSSLEESATMSIDSRSTHRSYVDHDMEDEGSLASMDDMKTSLMDISTQKVDRRIISPVTPAKLCQDNKVSPPPPRKVAEPNGRLSDIGIRGAVSRSIAKSSKRRHSLSALPRRHEDSGVRKAHWDELHPSPEMAVERRVSSIQVDASRSILKAAHKEEEEVEEIEEELVLEEEDGGDGDYDEDEEVMEEESNSDGWSAGEYDEAGTAESKWEMCQGRSEEGMGFASRGNGNSDGKGILKRLNGMAHNRRITSEKRLYLGAAVETCR